MTTTLNCDTPIFLIGFMGAGKTTLGRALTKRLYDWRYIDLDDYIEQQHQLTIRSLFAQFGEQAFRKMERDALHEAAGSECRKTIIGCGGGTPCHFDNIAWMNSRGLTVRLEATVPVLLRRLTEAQHQRPLLNGLTTDGIRHFIEQTLAERSHYYSQAHMTFDSDHLETEPEIEESCTSFIAMIREYDRRQKN